jgi:hypothetical protein
VREKVKTPAHRGVPFVTLDGGAILYNSPTLDLLAEVCFGIGVWVWLGLGVGVGVGLGLGLG